MRFILGLAIASLAAATSVPPIAASSVPIPWTALNKKGINWQRCTENRPYWVQCAEIRVPLDYTSPESQDTVTIDLMRWWSEREPRKGSIIVEFGNNGNPNIPKLIRYNRRFFQATGREYDLVTWNLRGTGRSIPFDCGNNYVPGQATRVRDSGHNITSWAHMWEDNGAIAKDCHFQFSERGDLYGTAFHARDLMQVVDALQEDGMLRFWGMSSGSIIGATAAAMFPERVDKVLLDGVENIYEYYHGLGTPSALENIDNTFHAFLKHCVASPHTCQLARAYRTVDNIKFLLGEFYKELQAKPRDVGGIMIDLPRFQAYLFRSLYYPGNYTALATTLDRLVTGDMEALVDVKRQWQYYTKVHDLPVAIRCGDNDQRVPTRSDYEPILKELQKKTKWFPYVAEDRMSATCPQWPFRAKEIYGGGFNITTKNPVLIIGNEFDPLTPWEGAKNLSESFNNAVALRFKAFGHASPAQNSDCVWDVVNRYFMHGDVPVPGTWCDPDEPIFSNSTQFTRVFGQEAGDFLSKAWSIRYKYGYCEKY